MSTIIAIYTEWQILGIFVSKLANQQLSLLSFSQFIVLKINLKFKILLFLFYKYLINKHYKQLAYLDSILKYFTFRHKWMNTNFLLESDLL